MDTQEKDTTVVTPTGRELSDGLLGNEKERMTEEKTMLLKLVPGQRPIIIFTGFWNGKFIKAAMNGIARAYRKRRIKPTHQKGANHLTKGGEGDV